ncbi:MAG: ATP-binding cassette domain-containing protein [Rhodospirillum sp.]|nr:ATP-binding cassette domain-containing protein [Rhodospirillum sp.]MCF8490244.1 ATP-binding cassette domain-containing protein [Rhodospirillum sp.]MCF8501259.1 ATP-binding cassette domain-containing protein [Rhodospirillum sp.]
MKRERTGPSPEVSEPSRFDRARSDRARSDLARFDLARFDLARFDLEGVCFRLPERELLAPLSLTLPRGRVIGLIGHNGSGKSTLIKMLARQQAPTSGTIRFNGAVLRTWGERAFAREVGYLAQCTPAAPGLLVKELVALGRYPWHGALGRFGGADHDKVAEAMAAAKVSDFADTLIDVLSGGERQRAWLAMLLAQDVGWLLLDEPISALDLAHQVGVLSLVRDLSVRRGLGVLVVLHDVNMAARYCDEIIALRHGRLIMRGAPDEVMRPECLEEIYDIPMAVMRHPESGLSIGIAC